MIFSFEEVCELVRLVGSTEVASVEIADGESRLRIKGRPQPQVQQVAAPAVSTGVPVTPVLQEPMPMAPGAVRDDRADVDAGEDEDLHMVISPIVGTFYRAPSPDSDPYVKVGDYVEKGQVLCIIEAMKLMNEIEADASGTIVKIFPKNEEPVEFGQNLCSLRLA